MIPRQELFEIIVERLGLRELNTEQQGEIISRLQNNILSAINLAVLERLSKVERQELLKLADSVGEEQVNQFLRSKIADLDSLMKKIAVETVEEFKRLRV